MDDATAVALAVSGAQVVKYEEGYKHALYDHNLPAFVRAFIAMTDQPATITSTLREAGMTPKLYATYKGRRCRIILLSAMGDIGITWEDKEFGYDERGITWPELSEFSQEMIPGSTPPEPRLRQYALADRKGFWLRHDAATDALVSSDVPALHVERSKPGRLLTKFDRLGLKGLRVVTVRIARDEEDR